MSKKPALEIDEDMNFQRKEWFAQRVGVALLSLVVVGALLGMTGMGGPLSHGVAGEAGGPVRLEYERFVRRRAMATLKVHLARSPGVSQVWMSDAYLERVRVESVEPEPERVSVEAGRHVYTIRTSSPQATVTIEVEHRTFGRVEGEIGLLDGQSFRFSQFSLF